MRRQVSRGAKPAARKKHDRDRRRDIKRAEAAGDAGKADQFQQMDGAESNWFKKA